MRRLGRQTAIAVAIAILLIASASPRPALANALPYYYLPWDSGVSHVVTQGNNQGSHTGYGAYAWDFGGDGWLVRAARAGTVSLIKDDSNTGYCDPSWASYANFVKVASSDGYEALYLHLAYGSVSGRVSLGQSVAGGTPVGLTDNTGYSCGPHLHYQVQSQCPSYWCQSVASSFLDPDVLRQDPDGVPLVNQTVVSANSAPPPPSTAVAHTWVAPNKDGSFNAFVRNFSGDAYLVKQTLPDNTWSTTYMGAVLGSRMTAAVDVNARVAVFATTAANHLVFLYQGPDNTWPTLPATWNDIGSGFFGTPAASVNAGGGLEVFVRDLSGAIQDCAQQGLGSVSFACASLTTTPFVDDPVVGLNRNGSLEVFAKTAAGSLLHNWQVPASGYAWQGWASTTANCCVAEPPAVAMNAGGGLELFFRDQSGNDYHMPDGGVSCHCYQNWLSLSNGNTSYPFAVGINRDGRLDAFSVGGDGSPVHNPQRADGSWSGWACIPDSSGCAPPPSPPGRWCCTTGRGAIELNGGGGLEYFNTSDGTLYHAYQTSVGGPYSTMVSLGGTRWVPPTSPQG
jgi:hypothetical protein